MPEITLQQLKSIFKTTADGKFATEVSKTKGIVYLDSQGCLKCAGNHGFRAVAPKTNKAEDNFRLRNALVETFRKNSVCNKALWEFQAKLGLTKNGMSNGQRDANGQLLSSKPIERRLIKQMFKELGKPGKVAEDDAKPPLERSVESVRDLCKTIAGKLGKSAIEQSFHAEASRVIDELSQGSLTPRGALNAIEQKLTLTLKASIINKGQVIGRDPEELESSVQQECADMMTEYEPFLCKIADGLGIPRQLADEFEKIGDKTVTSLKREVRLASYVRQMVDNPTGQIPGQMSKDDKLVATNKHTLDNLEELFKLRLADPPLSATLLRRFASYEVVGCSFAKQADYYTTLVTLARNQKTDFKKLISKIEAPKARESEEAKRKRLDKSVVALFKFCFTCVKGLGNADFFAGGDLSEQTLKVILSVVESECPKEFSVLLKALKAHDNISELIKRMQDAMDYGSFENYRDNDIGIDRILNQIVPAHALNCLRILENDGAALHYEHPL